MAQLRTYYVYWNVQKISEKPENESQAKEF